MNFNQDFLEDEIGANMMGVLRRYIDDKIPPGDFLMAVLTNDLKEAVGRADDHNLSILHIYVMFLYNYAPAKCWGSIERVTNWLSRKEIECEE